MKARFFASTILVLSAVLFCFSGNVFASHPLITDDAGTVGKGKFQLEVNGLYAHDSNNGVKVNGTEIAAALTYGLTDHIDLVIGAPYDSVKATAGNISAKVDGISDTEIAVKWQFHEKDGLSFALKPVITLPTGDDAKGLGTGKSTYSMFFITTKEAKPWAFHLNLGYIRNENKVDERTDIWHVSLASELEITEHLKAVADIGIEKNPDKLSSTNPAFILGGLIYSVSEHVDLDCGVKGGLNKAEPDYAVLGGITLKF